MAWHEIKIARGFQGYVVGFCCFGFIRGVGVHSKFHDCYSFPWHAWSLPLPLEGRWGEGGALLSIANFDHHTNRSSTEALHSGHLFRHYFTIKQQSARSLYETKCKPVSCLQQDKVQTCFMSGAGSIILPYSKICPWLLLSGNISAAPYFEHRNRSDRLPFSECTSRETW